MGICGLITVFMGVAFSVRLVAWRSAALLARWECGGWVAGELC